MGFIQWILSPVRKWFRPKWQRIEWERRSGPEWRSKREQRSEWERRGQMERKYPSGWADGMDTRSGSPRATDSVTDAMVARSGSPGCLDYGEVSPAGSGASDAIEVRLDDLFISVARTTSSTLPHEVTVVVPRAEIIRRYENGRLAETRIVYSSITVSHAPRFPPAQP